MLTLSEPKIIERGPYKVVGCFCNYEGNDESPGWQGADKRFFNRRDAVTNRADDLILGFLYRPHNDHPEIPEDTKACFIGVEVTDLDCVPEGMSTTTFSGGQYAVVACIGDTESESAEGVGEAIGFLENAWVPHHGFTEGDGCFAAGNEKAPKPPFVEYVYMKIEKHT